MIVPAILPPQAELLSLFDYHNGILIAKSGPKKGMRTGHATSKGYRKVRVFGTPRFEHRVIWKLIHGNDPDVIDHINGDRGDNRVENLRSVSISQNARFARRHRGASNYKGVYAARGGRWGARIKADRKTVHLGTYDCEVIAAFAYDLAARKLHHEFAITNECLGLLNRFPRSEKRVS